MLRLFSSEKFSQKIAKNKYKYAMIQIWQTNVLELYLNY